MRAKPSKIKPLFLQCSIYFFILHLLLQFSNKKLLKANWGNGVYQIQKLSCGFQFSTRSLVHFLRICLIMVT